MRSNFMLDTVLGKGPVKPSLEDDAVNTGTDAGGVETADTIEELLPLETATPEEEKEELIEQITAPEGEVSEELEAEAKVSKEAIREGLVLAFESEADLTDSIAVAPQPRLLTWEEMKAEIVPVEGEEYIGDYEEELDELREIVDVTDRVDQTIDMVHSMESATALDLSYLNITLKSFGKQLGVSSPSFESVDGKVSKDSLEAVQRFREGLRRFALQTYANITAQ